MKNRHRNTFFLLGISAFLIVLVFYIKYGDTVNIEKYVLANRLPNIRPDYSGTIIPPNIAPLNFIVEEFGTDYYVKIYSSDGEEIEVFSKTPNIVIPINSWKRLLSMNHNQKLCFDVYVRAINGDWTRFGTITNTISNAEIDGYIVYRLFRLQYNYGKKFDLYQRNIQNYDESLVLSNKSFGESLVSSNRSLGYGCMNCHTFLNNNPDNMILHLRGRPNGSRMLIIQNGEIKNVYSQTKFGSRPASYISWHPSGRLLVFSFNKICQFFHSARMETRDGLDFDSGLAFYDVDSKTIKYKSVLLDSDRLESYPTWSPDGKFLYFSSAPRLWPADCEDVPPDRYKENRYDLMRVTYDIEKNELGEIETVLSAKETGLGILQPRVSPDGRFLLFCMLTYGAFPTLNTSSDIYLMDLKTGEYRPIAGNSDKSESWHSWSSNSHWFVFSSKKGDGLFLKAYFCYVDENGKTYKPFVLPQKNPSFYDSFYKLYQLPELIKKPIRLKEKNFVKAINLLTKIPGIEPITSATPSQPSAPSQYR